MAQQGGNSVSRIRGCPSGYGALISHYNFTKVLDMKLVELSLGHFGWVENQTLENTLSFFFHSKGIKPKCLLIFIGINKKYFKFYHKEIT
jgi:hypothetical protein